MKLGEALLYEQPTKYIVENELYNNSYKTPVLTAGKSFILGHTNEINGIYENLPCIIFDDFTTDMKYVDFPFKVKSSAMKILTTDNKNDLRFLYHFLSTVKVDTELHKRYWISRYAELNVTLPSISEQQRIAAELDVLCGVLAKQKQQYKLLGELVKSKFNEMFSDPGFESVKIGDMFRTTSGGTPTSDKEEFYKNGTIPWLTSGEINQGIIQNVQRRITRLGVDNSSAKLIPVNSVVIAMYGATAGKVGLLKCETTTNQAVCAVLPNDEFESLYLYYELSSKYDWFISQSAGGAQPNISQTVIRRLIIKKPPLPIQQQFADFVNQVEQNKGKLKDEINQTETLYKALMQKYFGDKGGQE